MKKTLLTSIIIGAIATGVLVWNDTNAQITQLLTKEEKKQVIEQLQLNSFSTTEKYLQVLKDGTVLDGEKIINNKEFPANVEVHVYEGANGKGYQIMFEENGIMYSYGFGGEADIRTYQYRTASST